MIRLWLCWLCLLVALVSPVRAGGGCEASRILVEEIDPLFAELGAFFDRIYDRETGGFFNDARREGRPSLESTARAARMIERLDLWDPAGRDAQVAGIVAFVQRFQDPQTGFFDDPQERRPADERRGRAIGYARNVFARFGAEPLYPWPTEREAALPELEFLADPESFLSWLRALPWDRDPWLAGSILEAQGALIGDLPEGRRAPIEGVLVAELARTQGDDGWWGSGSPWRRMSAAFKISNFYRRLGLEFPHGPTAARSAAALLIENEPDDSCFPRNALSLIRQVHEATPVEGLDLVALARALRAHAAKFRRDDGGFVRHESARHGSTDGVSQMLIAREQLAWLLGLDGPDAVPSIPARVAAVPR